MAIDTATKRASALLEPGQLVYPPDGAISSAEDRGIPLEFYSGIGVTAPAVPDPLTMWRWVLDDRDWQFITADKNYQFGMDDRNWRVR